MIVNRALVNRALVNSATATDRGSGRVHRFGTVRFRITLLASTLVALALVGASIGLIAVQRNLLTRAIDEALQQRADNLAPAVAREVAGREPLAEGDREDSFVQVLDATGRVVIASTNVTRLAPVVGPLTVGVAERTTTVSGVAVSSHEFRVFAQRIRTDSGVVTLVVAKNLDDVTESVEVLEASLAWSVPIVVLLLAALVWWLTGRVLRPVEAIRAQVAAISSSELHRRVPSTGRDDEIARLARTMNEMLDRVEYSAARQQRFIADASHELRSPLTRIRTQLDLCVADPDAEAAPEIYRSLLADTTDLQQLIDDLLLAARLDAGEPVGTEIVDMDDLVVVEARRLRERAQVTVDTAGVSAARVSGHAGQLARVIRNLADNAERHATSRIVFSLRETGEFCELVVRDDGPGIPVHARETIFEPFTRLDEARSRGHGGTGLGLAIVRDIVAHHGGTIAVTGDESGGCRFLVTLPRTE